MRECMRVAAVTLAAVMTQTTHAAWTTKITKDQMTGEVNAYASSDSMTATQSMGFPYTNTKAWLGVGCDTDGQWAYVGFSTAPNLNRTETKDGYNRIRTRIKWNESVTLVILNQEWGDRFLHFTDDNSAIDNIVGKHTVLLELNWHGEGKTYFRFSLDGSAAAVAKIRAACGLG